MQTQLPQSQCLMGSCKISTLPALIGPLLGSRRAHFGKKLTQLMFFLCFALVEASSAWQDVSAICDFMYSVTTIPAPASVLLPACATEQVLDDPLPCLSTLAHQVTLTSFPVAQDCEKNLFVVGLTEVSLTP